MKPLKNHVLTTLLPPFWPIFALFLLVSCSAMSPPQLKGDIEYEKDLKMKIKHWTGSDWSDSKTIVGMGVVPKASKYKIRVEPLGKADMIVLLSCHRQWKTPHPERRGGWFSKKYYEFQISPTEEHEVEKACSFDAGVYEKKKGRHGWGLIVVDSEREKLGALVKCNGRTTKFNGTSVCQAKTGLIQSIHFDRPMRWAGVVGCEIQEPDDKKNWIFLMPQGECITFFVDDKDASIFHKAVWFGYDKLPIRGVE